MYMKGIENCDTHFTTQTWHIHGAFFRVEEHNVYYLHVHVLINCISGRYIVFCSLLLLVHSSTVNRPSLHCNYTETCM